MILLEVLVCKVLKKGKDVIKSMKIKASLKKFKSLKRPLSYSESVKFYYPFYSTVTRFRKTLKKANPTLSDLEKNGQREYGDMEGNTSERLRRERREFKIRKEKGYRKYLDDQARYERRDKFNYRTAKRQDQLRRRNEKDTYNVAVNNSNLAYQKALIREMRKPAPSSVHKYFQQLVPNLSSPQSHGILNPSISSSFSTSTP